MSLGGLTEPRLAASEPEWLPELVCSSTSRRPRPERHEQMTQAQMGTVASCGAKGRFPARRELDVTVAAPPTAIGNRAPGVLSQFEGKLGPTVPGTWRYDSVRKGEGSRVFGTDVPAITCPPRWCAGAEVVLRQRRRDDEAFAKPAPGLPAEPRRSTESGHQSRADQTRALVTSCDGAQRLTPGQCPFRAKADGQIGGWFGLP